MLVVEVVLEVVAVPEELVVLVVCVEEVVDEVVEDVLVDPPFTCTKRGCMSEPCA